MAEPAKTKDSTTPTPPKKVIVKSPKWPTMSFTDALEKAQIIYNYEKRNPTTGDVMLSHLGFKTRTGPANRTFAALRAYGLTEKQPGGNYVISDRAWRILVALPQDSPEREQLMRQAALSPSLFKEIVGLYPNELPSDAALKSYLILNKGFNENTVERFLRVFKATIAVAKPYDSDYTPASDEQSDEDEEDDQMQQTPTTGAQVPLRSPTKQEMARIFSPTPLIDGKELRFNISRDSEAQVIFRGPVTQEAIDKLAKMLELQKDTFPTTAELAAVEVPENDQDDAQAKGAA